MFTGIIAAVGTLAAVQPDREDLRLRILTRTLDLSDVHIGDSIAVQGACLTVTAVLNDGFWADVSGETLRCTLLGDLVPGAPVNLEKALMLSSRLGGHLVSGHVDGLGTIVQRQAQGRSTVLYVRAPDVLAHYIAPKGSICVDGVSLTVNHVAQSTFSLNIIPQTLAETTLGGLKIGQRVHVEIDIIARYLERLLQGQHPTPAATDGVPITEALLKAHGFWH